MWTDVKSFSPAAIACALGLAACQQDPAGASADGAHVFDTICTMCHGPKGKPDAVMVAKLGVKDLTSPALRATLDVDRVEAQVRDGSKNKMMPAFAGALTDAQIKAVAAYVMSPKFLTR
jgi:mono/diheme cytochrome c family protein